MIDKIKDLILKYNELKKSLEDTEIIEDYNKFSKINKEIKSLEPIVTLYNRRCEVVKEIDENKKLLNTETDTEIKNLIKNTNTDLENELLSLDDRLKTELLPKDKDDNKDVILEIHAGTGGDESGIFAGDLFKMYSRYIENKGWNLSIISYIESNSGGYKEIICNIKGDGVYSVLKYESGVHRVQRVPKTESKGRIHTSAVSVVVMPEVEDMEIDINMSDIRKDTFCSTGAGGQSVNTTYSAVRLTHIPSGLVVTCQDERSQIKNFEKAMKVLKSRLYKINEEKQQKEIGDIKRSIVKHGDRSDKIRTYNFPQNRITDHRINFTVYNLDKVLLGELDELIEALKIADNTEKLKNTVF